MKNKYTQEQLDMALFKAAETGNVLTIDLLLSSGANVNYKDGYVKNTALMEAAKADQVDACKMLLEYGAPIDDRGFSGNTAMYQAAITGRRNACLFLISRGADTENYLAPGQSNGGFALEVKGLVVQSMGMREAALRLGDSEHLLKLMAQPAQSGKQNEQPSQLAQLAKSLKKKDILAQLQAHAARSAMDEVTDKNLSNKSMVSP